MTLEDCPVANIIRCSPDYNRTPYYETMFDMVELVDGEFAEFGVYQGHSAKILSRWLPIDSKFYLFDSFEGLPEDFSGPYVKGSFATEVPELGDSFVIVKGYYDDTVVKWAKNQKKPISFVHIDADLYSSTMTALCGINDLIVPGTLISFDEILECDCLPDILKHEMKALNDWADTCGREYDWLLKSNHAQAAVVVRK